MIPQFELKPNYLGRYLASALFTSLIMLCFFLVPSVGLIILLPVIVLIPVGLLSIQFPSIQIYSSFILIQKRGLLNRFSTAERISFNNIESCNFDEGYFDRGLFSKLTALGTLHYGGYYKPDFLRLTMKDGSVKYIRLNGPKKGRQKFARIIGKKI